MLSLRSTASIAIFAFALTAGCATGGPDATTTSSDPTEPCGTSSSAKHAGSSSSSSSSSSHDTSDDSSSDSSDDALGPQCQAYLDCCDQIAESQPSMSGSCDGMRDQLANVQDEGLSTSSYEPTCKSAHNSLRNAGLCD